MTADTTKDITIYALSTCVHCAKLKELLDELVGPSGYRCHYMDRLAGEERNDRMRELRRANSELSFPTAIIDGEVVIGNKQDKVRELLG